MKNVVAHKTMVLCLAPALLASSFDLAAQEADEVVDEVIVTGTRIQERTRLDSLAPVDVISTRELSAQGSTELAQALSVAAPSINFPRPSITDGTDVIRPATLRGLAPDQTLVLLNSRRQHQSSLVNVNGSIGRGSSGVDLNTIPVAAIERVEVLRDGASAQYGSDAIGGVINLQLRRARSGGGAVVTYGGYNTTVSPARSSRKEKDGETGTVSVWTGLPLGSEGFLTLTGEYRDRKPTSRGDLDIRVAALTPPEAPRITSRFGDPKTRDATFFANGGLPFANNWELYGWAGYQQRDGESAAFPRLRNNANNDPAVYPNGFLPLIATDINDISAGFGTKGEAGGWRTDISLVYGYNKVDYRTENSINGTLIPNSPTSFESGGFDYDQLVFNADIARSFDLFSGIASNLAIGVEARRESYSITAGEVASYVAGPRQGAAFGSPTPGAQGFPGFQPGNEVDEDRRNVAVYAELETPFTDSFTASVAVRGEDYSDFGSELTWKASARYDFTPAFALRGTVSTGFRAPGLQQSYFTSTATNFIGGIPFEVGTFPPSSAVAQALGAQPLQPEESTNYSLGTVFRLAGFQATVDVYRIKIDDRIVLSENLGGTPAIDALLQPFGIGRARFFINGVDTTTKGVDAVLHYALPATAAGKWDFTLSANWNKTDVTSLPSTNVIPQGGTLFGRINVITFEQGQPDNKQSLLVSWDRPMGAGMFGATMKATHYGKVVEPQPTAPLDVYLGSAVLVDLELRTRFGEGLTAAIGADNLLDKYPTKTAVAVNTTGATSYSRYSPFGFNGRFLYARLGYNW